MLLVRGFPVASCLGFDAVWLLSVGFGVWLLVLHFGACCGSRLVLWFCGLWYLALCWIVVWRLVFDCAALRCGFWSAGCGFCGLVCVAMLGFGCFVVISCDFLVGVGLV